MPSPSQPDDSHAKLAGTPQPGTLLAGKYRIERVIGVGGMGVVLAAHHEELGERVAVKCLLPELAHDAVFVTRFQREARAAVKIRSEHVARVLDVAKDESGLPFMVMEYLEGKDLGGVLEAEKRISIDKAIGYVLQACEALAEAHALGIVHRDLKPENLFLTQHADGTEYVKVMDFGISKMANAGPDNLSLTRTGGGVMGSPLYMAPEQMRSAKDADARTDIWALGAILFELIVGDPPFMAASIQEIVAMIVQDATPSLTERAAAQGVSVPEGLDLAVQRALQKQILARFSDVADFAIAIAPFGDDDARASAARIMRVLERRGRGHTASNPSISLPVPPPSAPSLPVRREGVGTQSAATWTDIRPPAHPRSRTILLAALAVFGVAAIGTALAVVLRPAPPTATLPQPSSAIPVQAAAPIPSADPVVTTAASSTAVDPAPLASSVAVTTTSKKPGGSHLEKVDKVEKVEKPDPKKKPDPAPIPTPPPVASTSKPNSGLASGRHD